ncbi:4-coumarate--CoA ligase 1-like [Leguminivora glycinivorella]|uniref:4-coumarate--CoA ligase 1-like n=1 Tax=Leguminivora glycinivorella TaxID=1035111 RepID=UPI00200F0A67|nr:4-coumarate--CoA ligase 1-like [Leguminivora glycinivorella]
MSSMFKNNLYVYGDENIPVPSHLNFGKYIFDCIKKYCKSNEVALENSLSGEKISYKDLIEYAVNAAVFLKDLGVENGQTVGIGSEKRIQFFSTALAVVFTGATYTPLDLDTGRAVLEHKLNLSKPKYFICSQIFWETYQDILKECDFIQHLICFDENDDIKVSLKTLPKVADVANFDPPAVQGQTDTAVIMYSSGTTGMPKGVQLTHLNFILNCQPYGFEDESMKTMFIIGEWFHVYDTLLTYMYLTLGRKIVFVDDFTSENMMKAIQICKVDLAMLVPSLVGYMVKSDLAIEQYDLSSLKFIFSRAAPLGSQTIDFLKKRLPTLRDVIQVYGMTESGCFTSERFGVKGPKSGSVGAVYPGITLKVMDPKTGETLGANQRGEIRVRVGPLFMKGYIGMDRATYIDEDGFFSTGDLGYYDEDKYFYIVGRLKEIIFYDGYKTAPSELETILEQHPGVREAGVVGKPAGDIGEDPVAFIVRQPGTNVSEQELIDYIATAVPPYMHLRGGVIFVPVIPRNQTGKIIRRRLMEMLKAGQ